MSENIDWDSMVSGSFIKLEDGKVKRMTLGNWKNQDKFKDDKTGDIRPGLTFDVTMEDGEVFTEASKKEWTVTAKGCLGKLRPIIEKAVAEGRSQVTVDVTAVGEKSKRQFAVNEFIGTQNPPPVPQDEAEQAIIGTPANDPTTGVATPPPGPQ